MTIKHGKVVPSQYTKNSKSSQGCQFLKHAMDRLYGNFPFQIACKEAVEDVEHQVHTDSDRTDHKPVPVSAIRRIDWIWGWLEKKRGLWISIHLNADSDNPVWSWFFWFVSKWEGGKRRFEVIKARFEQESWQEDDDWTCDLYGIGYERKCTFLETCSFLIQCIESWVNSHLRKVTNVPSYFWWITCSVSIVSICSVWYDVEHRWLESSRTIWVMRPVIWQLRTRRWLRTWNPVSV